jgi:hypothetical protein
MLTHMHPSPDWFACQPSPPLRAQYAQFNVWAAPGTAKRPESLCPPPALPSAARCPASRQRALPRFHRSYGLMRRTKPLLPTWFFTLTAGLRRLSSVPAGRWPFPTLSPQSVSRRPDLYPAGPSGITHLRLRLTGDMAQRASAKPSGHKAWHSELSCTATSAGGGFRGGSHSLRFRLPDLLGPPVAPTVARQRFRANGLGSRAVYITQ